MVPPSAHKGRQNPAIPFPIASPVPSPRKTPQLGPERQPPFPRQQLPSFTLPTLTTIQNPSFFNPKTTPCRGTLGHCARHGAPACLSRGLGQRRSSESRGEDACETSSHIYTAQACVVTYQCCRSAVVVATRVGSKHMVVTRTVLVTPRMPCILQKPLQHGVDLLRGGSRKHAWSFLASCWPTSW